MTLTELSYYSRKMLPFLVIFFLVVLIIFYLFKLIFLYLQLQPKDKVININPVFGKIRRPALKEPLASSSADFVLDTIEGQPITATDTAKIYFLPPSYSRLKFLQQIYLMAKAVGFDTENVKHSLVNTEATFDDGQQKMTIDITNFNFSYEYKLRELNRDNFFENSRLPNEGEIQNKAANFLNAVGRYPEELAQWKRNLVYLTYEPDSQTIIIVPQSAVSNIVEVDFYRADIDNFPIVSPKYFNSPNYVMIAFSKDGFRIVKAQVNFFERSKDQVGIYPIKTGEAAWQELKNNQEIVINPASGKTVNIKKMFLGYFDPDVYQNYLQPVYVFLGDNNFVGYVAAIDNKYLQN